jgi:hypothetical protein
MMSVISDIIQYPFWIVKITKVPLIYMMVFSIFRIFKTRNNIKKAFYIMKSKGVKKENILPILIRLYDHEIDSISRFNNLDFILNNPKDSMRLNILKKLYF